ncbi:hypothetical protein E4K10_02310 [Streptomyces sp. T1317-0309]|nr:hypothetical protein E4K10_02310 [Streptomyces sp. T1317-0309]
MTAVLEGRMDEARRSFNAEVLAAFTDEVRGTASPRSPAWSARSRGSARASPSSGASVITRSSTSRSGTRRAT